MTDHSAELPVAFHTLGCKVNRVESEDIAADLIGRGVSVVAQDAARVVVVNTCTVTGEADAKARKAVRAALKSRSRPIVVVTGCLAAIDAAALRALGDRVIVEPDKERVAERVASALSLSEGTAAPVTRTGTAFRTRALVKVEDGCDAYCAYCVVPYARGNPRSVPLASVVRDVESLVRAGTREIVLTGINLGRYADGSSDLGDLIHAVAGTGIARVRISSIEPMDLTERLLGILASSSAVCPHLHVPLQSGSDEVLAAMRRGYRVSDFERHIEAARAALPGLAVTTDVIAGFPGETDRQALETLEACERIRFSKLHVFRYSPRQGTPAASMAQVSPQAKNERAAALREAGQRLRSRFAESRIGTVADVLIERAAERAEGTTPDYLRVAVAAAVDLAIGDVVRVRIDAIEGDVLLGRLA